MNQRWKDDLLGGIVGLFFTISLLSWAQLTGAELEFEDSAPQRYEFRARASALNPEAREYPAIDFVFEKDGDIADWQTAAVDTRVEPRGELVIWMMRHNPLLFERLTSYGQHVIQPHYANRWFSKVCREEPVDPHCRGNMRLEAATGLDFSDAANIQKPDGMMARAVSFVQWLSQENPGGKWDFFLTDDRSDLRWERVVMAGASHGSTTSARFAKYQKVRRVVMLCGPRDQHQVWQDLPSVTPKDRYFGFSHVLDMGWEENHYPRSWKMLGLEAFGPIVNVDLESPPYKGSRQLISKIDVGGSANRAHSAVQPGSAAPKNDGGEFLYEPVWRYLFTYAND